LSQSWEFLYVIGSLTENPVVREAACSQARLMATLMC
jgi:hypothetical protein